MIKKLSLLLFIGFIFTMLNCGSGRSNLKWERSDFRKWEASNSGSDAFELKYLTYKLGAGGPVKCKEFLTSSIFVDSFPEKKIAQILGRKYGISIKTNNFSRARKAGKFKFSSTLDKSESSVLTEKWWWNKKSDSLVKWRDILGTWEFKHNDSYVHVFKADGLIILCRDDSRLDRRFFDTQGGLRGKTNQLQVYYDVSWTTITVLFRLCVMSGNKDKDGFRKLDVVAEHEIEIGKYSGCSAAEAQRLKKSIKNIPVLLERSL